MDKIDIDLDNKYFCYILGIIWADGYLYSKHKTKNRIEITMIYDDLKNIEYIFDKVGIWKKYTRIRKNKNHKIQLNFRIINKELYLFLKENDYEIKSKTSPDKIISLIPKYNLKYFIHGLFDGDGCFYHRNKTKQCIFTSNYDQNWKFLSNILENISCKYSIGKQTSKRGSRSFLRMSSKDILKFGNYIYDDFFGLERKYKKYLDIKISYNKEKIIIGHNKREISIDKNLYPSITEAAIKIGISMNCLRYRLKSKNYNNYFYII